MSAEHHQQQFLRIKNLNIEVSGMKHVVSIVHLKNVFVITVLTMTIKTLNVHIKVLLVIGPAV